ncbi:hypothetical protein Tam10B_1114 [Bifidobacterium vansinderenii]|uniref:DUF5067 domain-containing protein n=1 Tax=Bifidobacterium vansinderenii TaxID=1984871 RepID=A0A229VYD8_9BIFI|nr:hypothetical protein Tam10B_1114 [Bifidobacterium vansinderenii]
MGRRDRGNSGSDGFGSSGDGYVSPFSDDGYVSHDDGDANADANYVNYSDDTGQNARQNPAHSTVHNDRRGGTNDGQTRSSSRVDGRYETPPSSAPKQTPLPDPVGNVFNGESDDSGSRSSNDTSSAKRSPTRFIPALIIMAIAFAPGFISSITDNHSSDSSSGSSQTTEAVDNTTYKTLDISGELKYYESSGSTGKTLAGKFAIVGAQRGPSDCNGQPTMLVTYQFTNLSKEITSAQDYLSYSVYHQGMGLRQIGCFAKSNPDGYNMRDISKDVQPKATHEFKVAYEMPDQAVRTFQSQNTGQDITQIDQDLTYDVRISNYSRNLPTSIGATITLPQDANDFNPTDVTKPRTIETSSATGDFKNGLQRIIGNSYVYSDVLGANKQIDVKAVSAKRGPDTYDGRHTVIVTYQWINHTKIPLTFNDAMTETAYQNGVELEKTVFSDPTDTYSVATRDAPVMPDVPTTTTIAYELRDDTSQVSVDVQGYANSDGGKASWKLNLE